MSHYSEGVRVEHAVMHHLTDNGYECIRASSSKGVADVVGIKAGQAVLVNVKRTTMPPPAERAALLLVAAHLHPVGVPLVALKPLRRPLEFRRLTGPGPKDWAPWTVDDVSSARRRKVTPELLVDVARVYRENVDGNPTMAVADFTGRAHRTAALYVKQARKAGLLGATSPGRKGETTS